MKKTTTLSMMVAIALLTATSPASAEPSLNYVAFKAGVYSPSMSHDLNTFNAGVTSQLDSKTGFAGEVVIGHYFLPIFALELGAGYFESKGSPAAQVGEKKLKVMPLVATGKAILPLGIFEPYGLLGIGAYITELDVQNNTGALKGSTKVTYGLHAGGGLNVNFNKKMFVGVEGKYIWADPSFGGQHIRLDGFVTTAAIGFRF